MTARPARMAAWLGRRGSWPGCRCRSRWWWVIADADCLDPDLALALIRGLAGRRDGRVLVVAAAAPDSDLAGMLTRDPGYDLTGRVQRAEADPSMAYTDRAELAAELLPHLPAAGIERIARGTATFAEVFAVAEEGLLAELSPETETAEAVSVVDAVADAVLKRATAVAGGGGAGLVRRCAA